MVEAQKWNPEIKKTDYPYQVMGKYFGAKSDSDAWQTWVNMQKKHPEWIAKMAGVAVYNPQSIKQNTDIANRLRKNDVESFYNYKDNAAKIDGFDEMMKVNASTNLLDQQTMEYYISNLDNKQLSALNTLPPMQRLLFIAEECKNIETVQGEIKQKTIEFGGNIENKNLSVMKELDGVIERTNSFMKKIGQENWIIGMDGLFKGAQAEEEYAIYKKQIVESEEYKKMLEEEKDEKNIDKILRNGFRMRSFASSEAYSSLSENEKSEFGVLIVDYYMVTQKLNINIESLDLGMLYDRAREIMALAYGNQEKEPAHTLMNTINTDDQVIEFFSKEENKIDALSPEGFGSEKLESKAYYTKAFSFYPDDNDIEGGMKPIKEYLKYFNDDMTIKEDISESEKQEAEKALSYIKEHYASHEKVLVEKTNMIVQEHAMSQCIETLQKYMDIDIDEKENLLNTLEIMKGTDVISSADGELVLNIEGERNGKKISLSYDLISGNVYACPFLYKASVKDSDPLVMGNQTKHYETPLVTLASIRTILDSTKEANFKDMIVKSDNTDAYKDTIKGYMDKEMIFGTSMDYDITQDTLKKCVLKGDIVQDIISCTGKTRPAGTEIANEGIYQPMYEFYQYMYRSLEYYSMKSSDQLNLFKGNIEKMMRYRNTDQIKSVEDILSYKDGNQEMFTLQALVNPVIMPLTASKLNDSGPETNMSGFFKCFKKKIGGLEVIDVQMLDDYFTAAEGTNKVENKVGTWERNAEFESLVGDMETDLIKGQATADMYKQFDEQNIT